MKKIAKPPLKLKALATERRPKLLDEILPKLRMKKIEKWFIETLITRSDGTPIEVTDPKGRKIWITGRTLQHLMRSDSPGGASQGTNYLKMKWLSSLRPCLEFPLEIYQKKDRSFVYISPWKPERGKRYVVVARRVKRVVELKTHIIMDDASIEAIRRSEQIDWERP